MMKRTFVTVLMMWTLGALGAFQAGGPVLDWLQVPVGDTVHAQQPEPQDEFVPIDELPPQDQLPAAPLLVAAYAFVVLALFAYLVSVARRLGGVQRDLERLEADLKRSGRT
jgi:CcmD family protein